MFCRRTDRNEAFAYFSRGNVYRHLKKLDNAIADFGQAISIDHSMFDAHLGLGFAHAELSHFELAVASFDRALALQPQHAEAHTARGNALYKLEKFDAAITAYEKAIALDPSNAEIHFNHGVAQARRGSIKAAIASYDRAITIKPNYAQAYLNRGLLRHDLMRVDDAIADFDSAIAIKPDFTESKWNKALSLLLRGDYLKGWELFEYRHHKDVEVSPRNFSQPLWVGQADLAGKTILLHSEQGLGDTIQFFRYATLVADRAAAVILEVEQSLVELLTDLNGPYHIIAKGAVLPAFDYQCPLMSLPHAFKSELSTIPVDIPYLRANHEKAEAWQKRLGPKTTPRVGLMWSGGVPIFRPQWATPVVRNMSFPQIATLNVPSIEFYSLQKGEPGESDALRLREEYWKGGNFINVAGDIRNFADTASVIANLDLVVTVDTSVAHLAGAMGKPVWILNRFNTCWRWLQDRTDSPWYPSARIYRQTDIGDWGPVLDSVKSDLLKLQV